MVHYDFTRRKICHILYSVMFYKKYYAIFTCGTPIMSCTTVHPTQEIHTWKKNHVPQCAPQRAFIKIPGPCRQIPWQPAEETTARMTLRNIFPFKNERGPLWLDLLCKSKTILHKSKLKFTWTLGEKEKKCRSYVFLKSDNSLKNIHLFFFFTFDVFLRHLFLFTMLYSNEH